MSDFKNLPTPAELTKIIPANISDCSIVSTATTPSCLQPGTLQVIAEAIQVTNDESVLPAARSRLNCPDNKCVVEKMVSRGLIDKKTGYMEIANLKLAGPTDNALLNNTNIDHILQQWMIKFPRFFAYNFNMLNYADYSFRDGTTISAPDTLATIPWTQISEKYNCCACVINSDKYQGGGKHWMALFADWRSTPYTIEFYNSSGNAPAPEWINWMEKTSAFMEIDRLEKKTSTIPAKVIRVTSKRSQHSKTECGVYSLFYIWARLNGIPVDYFANSTIPDKLMFEFRQHLYMGPRGVTNGKFNWDEYQKKVNVTWEAISTQG